MTLYICSYCQKLALTLWPVTLDGKEREVCWTCIEEAADRSRFEVASTTHVMGERSINVMALVPTITKVEVQG